MALSITVCECFHSKNAILDGSKAIRGGIPLVFPQFGKSTSVHPYAELQQHGFARVSFWKAGEIQRTKDTVSIQLGTVVLLFVCNNDDSTRGH